VYKRHNSWLFATYQHYYSVSAAFLLTVTGKAQEKQLATLFNKNVVTGVMNIWNFTTVAVAG
jgi:hypothetical protein